ncbi:hypothetical protein [Kalamiella sp. sgz302252]|uniref:hypothetical protein n=1 Tax=Pantoea sp. sgz302252 TaxID=3341827 RepID=UPI0036D433A2
MKPSTNFVIFSVIIFALWTGFFKFIFNFDEKIVYHEEDFIKYRMLTDKDIASVPRISKHYYFVSYPGDGYAPANEIVFEETSDTEEIRAFLHSKGYKRERHSITENEVWKKPDDSGSEFYLYADKKESKVHLNKISGR